MADKRVMFETFTVDEDGKELRQKTYEDGTVEDLEGDEVVNTDKVDPPTVDENEGERAEESADDVDVDDDAEAREKAAQENLKEQQEQKAKEQEEFEDSVDRGPGFVPNTIEEAQAEATKLAAEEGDPNTPKGVDGIDLTDPNAPEEQLGMTQAEEQSARAPEEQVEREEKVNEKLAEKEAEETVKKRQAAKKKA